MNIKDAFSNYLIGWQDKLDEDEWYFAHFHEELKLELNASQAFEELNEFIGYWLETEIENEFIGIEIMETMLTLMRIADTTECNGFIF